MNQLTCDAVIFDLDGVLVDSTAIVERTWWRWAKAHSLDFEAIMHVAHGRRAVETIRVVAPHLDAEVEAARLAAEEACETNGLVRIEGAIQLVRSLPEGRWAVATSGTREIAATRLACTGVPQPTVLVTANDVEHGKPDPEAYTLAAERLGMPPERCIVIEDAPTGIAAARAARMRVVALATTFPCDELGEATFVVRRLSDIRASFDGGRGGCITLFLGGLAPSPITGHSGGESAAGAHDAGKSRGVAAGV